MSKKFEYTQAEEIRDVFRRHGARYLFIGKSGAILLGFPDTTQDADVFVEKSAENGNALWQSWASRSMTPKPLKSAEEKISFSSRTVLSIFDLTLFARRHRKLRRCLVASRGDRRIFRLPPRRPSGEQGCRESCEGS